MGYCRKIIISLFKSSLLLIAERIGLYCNYTSNKSLSFLKVFVLPNRSSGFLASLTPQAMHVAFRLKRCPRNVDPCHLIFPKGNKQPFVSALRSTNGSNLFNVLRMLANPARTKRKAKRPIYRRH